MKGTGGYKVVHVSSSLSKKKLSKASKGGTVVFSADDLKGSKPMLVHPANYSKIVQAQKANKGARLDFTEGEIHHDLSHHQGGSIWDSLRSGLSTAWNSVIKPVLSGVGDAIAYSNPELAPIREGIRKLSGVGFQKGSQAAKDRMALVRAKKRGGSFRLV